MLKVMLTIFPVFVQQQHPAADRSSGGSPMSLVHPKLHGTLPASQTPEIITPKVRTLWFLRHFQKPQMSHTRECSGKC